MGTSTAQSTEIMCDIVILGGGIAGLWLLNRLRNDGYHAIVLETDSLGNHQTIASQGMIHGGIKYALGGALSGASQAIADMPDHWRRCLKGEGDVDLTSSQVLSEHFYMWSSGGLGSKVKTFFASKATRGRVDALTKDQYPAVFQHKEFKGSLYQLKDIVLDVPSVLDNLKKNHEEWIYQYKWNNATFTKNDAGLIECMTIADNENVYAIKPQQFIFAAGEGNEKILNSLGISSPKMQRRPLQQVIVKHKNDYKLYAHCIGMSADATPRLTISTHKADDGDTIWYLGGDLSSHGVGKAPEDLISEARKELTHLFPWLDFSDASWATYPVDRAEPKQRGLLRPDNGFVEFCPEHKNILVAWPTKLTLAPNLANEAIDLLSDNDIKPMFQSEKLDLKSPEITRPIWSTLF